MNVPIDLTGVELRTERLLLRPWRMSDLADFYEYASVDGVGQMAGWQPHESIEKSKEILDRFIEGKKTFALECNGKVIGSLGVEKYDEERSPQFALLRCRELGFVLAKPYWGRGLMAEAVRRVIAWLFDEKGLDAILCGHFLSNAQSRRVQEKCGFRHLDFGQFTTRMGDVVDDERRVLFRRDFLVDRANSIMAGCALAPFPGDEELLLTIPAERDAAELAAFREECLCAGGFVDGIGSLKDDPDTLRWIERCICELDPLRTEPGRVPASKFVCIRKRDGRLLGTVCIRHFLNDFLEKYAGHIGYSVRPGERRRGVASWMLGCALRYAGALGLDRVLIGCLAENEPSRRTILRSGGRFDGAFTADDGKVFERYWIEL